MKKILFILASLLYVGICQAQTTAIKFNVPGVIFGNASFMAEHAISNKFSIGAGASFMILNKLYEVPEDYKQLADDAKGHTFTAEIRWFPSPSTGVMRNFYAAPYFRYGKFETAYDGTINIDEIGEIAYHATGELKEIGGGLQLGYQWVIKNRIVVDWFFLGPRISQYEAKANAVGPQTEIEFYAAVPIDKFVDSGFIPADDVKVEVSNEGGKASAKATLPGLRSGIAIGFCF